VARIYAGILGPLALLTCIARGIVHGGGTDSVRSKITVEIAAQEADGDAQ